MVNLLYQLSRMYSFYYSGFASWNLLFIHMHGSVVMLWMELQLHLLDATSAQDVEMINLSDFFSYWIRKGPNFRFDSYLKN